MLRLKMILILVFFMSCSHTMNVTTKKVENYNTKITKVLIVSSIASISDDFQDSFLIRLREILSEKDIQNFSFEYETEGLNQDKRVAEEFKKYDPDFVMYVFPDTTWSYGTTYSHCDAVVKVRDLKKDMDVWRGNFRVRLNASSFATSLVESLKKSSLI